MSGLYIHIPFCKSRCIYCGFYSTTHGELKQRYVDAACKEMRNVKQTEIGTIYIGGGTPSQLTEEQLLQLFNCIEQHFTIKQDSATPAEITMECNPDDITEEYAKTIAKLPVNRVSMGVQTFSNERLRFLNRRHTAEQIPVAVERLRKAGIKNISIDLMYGFPNETLEEWQDDITQAINLGVEHLSAYSLMYEEDTPLLKLLEQNKISEIDEELSLRMFDVLIERLKVAGYEHYEISNFAKNNYRSRHNSNYWNQTPYIGIGAAAHSYDGQRCRQWNIDNVKQYIEDMEEGRQISEKELLDDDTLYNEKVMTALRTCEGLDMNKLSAKHANYCLQQAKSFIADGLLMKKDNHLILTRRGLFVCNMVMSELMIV